MPTPESRFTVGMRIKPSLYALRSLRDSYLDKVGAARDRAKAYHDKEAAQRGTVTALLPDPKGLCSPGLEITWDDGGISRCLDYRVTPENDVY